MTEPISTVDFTTLADATLWKDARAKTMRLAGHSGDQTAAVRAVLTEFREDKQVGVSLVLQTRSRILMVAPEINALDVTASLIAYDRARSTG